MNTIALKKFKHFTHQVLTKVPFDKIAGNTLSLTVDIHYHHPTLEKLLGLLEKENISSTFFITGKFCEKYPDILKKMIHLGHEIGNHSYSHPKFDLLTEEEIATEINKTEKICLKTLNVSTKPLFRSPYGIVNAKIVNTVEKLGYKMIPWTIDTLDTVKQHISSEEIERKISSAQKGDIILMHSNSIDCIKGLALGIKRLKEKKIAITPIRNLLNYSMK